MLPLSKSELGPAVTFDDGRVPVAARPLAA